MLEYPKRYSLCDLIARSLKCLQYVASVHKCMQSLLAQLIFCFLSQSSQGSGFGRVPAHYLRSVVRTCAYWKCSTLCPAVFCSMQLQFLFAIFGRVPSSLVRLDGIFLQLPWGMGHLSSAFVSLGSRRPVWPDCQIDQIGSEF